MEKAQFKMHWKVREKKKYNHWNKDHKGPEKKFKKLKRGIIEIQSQEDRIEKGDIRKILNNKRNMKK